MYSTVDHALTTHINLHDSRSLYLTNRDDHPGQSVPWDDMTCAISRD